MFLRSVCALICCSSALGFAESGFVQNGEFVDVITLKKQTIEYRCSYGFGGGVNTYYEPMETFFSSTTQLPLEGARVIVTNVTASFPEDDRPFTDRNYSQGSYSDTILIKEGKRHKTRYFIVDARENFEVLNEFEYKVIKAGEEILEIGNFALWTRIEEEPMKIMWDVPGVCRDWEFLETPQLP